MSDQEFEVCWSGASWRQYPAPVLAASVEPRTRKTQAGAAMVRYSSRELVYACVDSVFCSVNAVKARTGLSDRTVRRILMEGAEDGTLDRIDQGRVGYTGGFPTFLYRKRQAQGVKAA